MSNTRRSGPDAGTVAAARAGDRQALEHLVAHSLPLVYNIVGRALNGHADTDDVVQETLLRMVRGLSELRDPAAFRSWLVAIAVRQVRNRQQDRAAALDRSAPIEEAEAIPDPALDFAGLTVLRLGLTEQRREIAEATRWLDPDDRELLALWWLKETGELEQADLVAALGLSSGHAAVRTGRMKKQLDLSRLLVRALAADPRCPGLAATTTGWDGTPGPLWRKRLARHVRDCARCTGERNGLLPAERLLYGLPLLAVPPSLDPARILAALTPGGPGAPHPGGPHPGGPHPGGPDGPDGPGGPNGPGGPDGTNGPGGHPGSSGGAPAGRGSGHRRPRPVRTAKPLLAKPVLGGAALVLVAAAVLVGAELVPGQDSAPAAAPAPSGAVAPPTAAEAAAPPEPDGASPSAPPAPSPSVPSPSPSASSPAPSGPVPPSATAAASAPVAQGAVVASARKGVGVWAFDGASQALAASGAGWYYTWGTQHPGISTPASASFVPMIWGASSVTGAALAQARANGPYLLGFNEPDMAAQSNLTVDRALELWPQLMQAGQTLGSPAVAYGADTPGGWLDRFMAGADAKGYRVDFITLHWYGGDFRTPQAVQQLTAYLEAVHRRYHKPIWLTEYALIDFSQGTRFPSADQQAAFVTASTEALDALPYLQRYAWFGLGADPVKPSSGLFTDGTTATAAGLAYRAAR